MRFFQSTGPFTLPPGGFEIGGGGLHFRRAGGGGGLRATVRRETGRSDHSGRRGRMAAGVNPIDSIAGYQGFTDANGDGRVDQSEFKVVPGSLLGKALVAQAVFDNGFLRARSLPTPRTSS